MKIRQTSLILLVLFCVAAFAQQKDTFKDTRDGKTYKTVKIGEQIWMAENLNYDAKVSKWSKCYNDSTSYCERYGRLYDWETAMKACPKSWHLPNNEEWDKLYRFVDSTNGTKSPYGSMTAGKYLKTKNGWRNVKGKSGNGEDKFDFSAMPGGLGNHNGNFDAVGIVGYWWSTNEYRWSGGWGHSEYVGSNAYYRQMYYYEERANYGSTSKFSLFSVRCLQD